MISNDFFASLELPPDKTAALETAIRKELFYRDILLKAGIMPGVIGNILKVTDTGNIDETKPELYIERARVEWRDFIGKNRG